MIKLLTFELLMSLYEALIKQSGGSYGVRDKGAVEAALEKPKATFGGKNLYPSLIEIYCPVDEQEKFILKLASGDATQEELVSWLTKYTNAST